VRSVGDAAEVTFTVDDGGLPIREDAQVEIRPRIFLEGNFFLNVRPGSPSAPELADGSTIPISHTSTAVQLDQLLTTLQAPDRENLSKLLRGYGTALNYKPTAADDRGQDPDTHGESAGQAINDSFKYGATAGRDSAIVSEALLGQQPGDLSNLIASQSVVFSALLEREQQLKDFVTNFNTFSGALAAESENLASTVRLLAPTLENAEPSLRHTNEMLPHLRAFALALEPGVRELPATIAASGPWFTQTRALLSKNELGFIADELRLTGPGAGAGAAASPSLFSQTELFSRCVSNVLVPTGNVELFDSGAGYDFDPGVPNYKEFGYAVSGLAGESQSFDGNGRYLRFQAGNGPVLVKGAQPGGGALNDVVYGHAPMAPIGTRPVLGPKPPFRTDVPCHLNAIPNLNGPAAAQGPPSPAP
jgi:hypothetical protein